ncbi:hypothetical protein GTH44_19845, partial [Bradyrhizobium japonicum]|nr:hypothetical protein [Bradyrhizobium japonicum]
STGCLGHGVLLVLAPLASLSLAGQEHGRTIPLADMSLENAVLLHCSHRNLQALLLKSLELSASRALAPTFAFWTHCGLSSWRHPNLSGARASW